MSWLKADAKTNMSYMSVTELRCETKNVDREGCGKRDWFLLDVAQNVVLWTNNQRKLTNLISPDIPPSDVLVEVCAAENVLHGRDRADVPAPDVVVEVSSVIILRFTVLVKQALHAGHIPNTPCRDVSVHRHGSGGVVTPGINGREDSRVGEFSSSAWFTRGSS